MIKHLKLLGFLFFTFTLSACNVDELDVSTTLDGMESRQAQSAIYAQSLLNYASKAEAALLSQESWTTLDEGVVNFAALADADVRMGTAEQFIDTALCREGDKATLVTWFSPSDKDNRLALKGLGGSGNLSLTETLTAALDTNDLARMTPDGLKTLGTLDEVALPGSNCNDLAIPTFSPVILTRLIKAEDVERLEDVETSEYTTASCTDPDQTGFRILSRSVLLEAGSEEATHGAWEEVQNTCRLIVTNEEKDVAELSKEGEALDTATLSMLSTSGSMGQTVRGALKNVECIEQAGRSSGKRSDSCAQAVSFGTLNSLDEIRDSNGDTYEQYTTGCGGSTGSEPYSQYSSTLTYTPWSGQAVFERELSSYITDSRLQDGANDDQTFKRGNWYGKTIHCTRPEQTVVDCNILRPSGIPGGVPLVTNGRYTLNRTATVSGWQNAFANEPADATHTAWRVSSVNCTWQDTRSYTPSCSCGVASRGTETRTFRGTNTIGQYSGGSWRVTNGGSCRACPPPPPPPTTTTSGGGGGSSSGGGGSSTTASVSCTAGDLVCGAYASTVGRAPDKGGAHFWQGHVNNMRNSGQSNSQIASWLDNQFRNSMEYKMQQGQTFSQSQVRAAHQNYDAYTSRHNVSNARSACLTGVSCRR